MVVFLSLVHLPARRGRPDRRAGEGVRRTTPPISSNACEV